MNYMLTFVLAAGLARPACAQAVGAAADSLQELAKQKSDGTFEDSLREGWKTILSMRIVVLYERTMQNVAKGNFLGAKDDFNSVLGERGLEQDDRAQMTGQRGMMEAASGDLAAAGPDLDVGIKSLEGKALSAEDKTMLANMRMLKGHVLFQQGRVLAALREEDEAVRLDPTYGMPNVFRGRFLLKLGRPGEAVRAFEAAVSLDPTIIVKKRHVCDEFRAAGQEPPSCRAASGA